MSGAAARARLALGRPAALVAALAAAWGLLLVAWALGNPPFAAPDEPAHYLRAVAVGGGSLGGSTSVEVPAGLWGTWRHPDGATCNAAQAAVPGSCIADLERTDRPFRAESRAAGYFPLSYLLPGALLRLEDDPRDAVRVGRLASAAVCLAFLVLGLALLVAPQAPGLSLIGAVAAVSPMVLFVGSTISSSGLEIASAFAFLAGLLRVTRGPPPSRRLWATVAVTGGVLALTRMTGVLWVALGIALALGLAGPRAAPLLRRAGKPAAAAAALLLGAMAVNRLWEQEHGWELTQRGFASGAALRDWLLPALHQLPRLLEELVGVFGWLDTHLPFAAYVPWQGLVAGLLTLAFVAGERHERIALASALAVLLALALFLSATLQSASGMDVQGRHLLPFALGIPLAAGEVLLRRRDRLAALDVGALLAWALPVAAAVHLFAWYTNARRQGVGNDGPYAFFGGGDWAPPLGWWPWAVTAAAGATLLALAGGARAPARARSPAPAPSETAAPAATRPLPSDLVRFTCNVCGAPAAVPPERLDRELPSCPRCGSTVRFRAVVHLLSLELFGRSLPLPDFPERPDLVGLGLSDWEGYARPLAERLGYTNTFLHAEPRLDITDLDGRREGTCDFVIASEVFEHVPPPVSRAFANLRRLLKHGGIAIFTAPYRTEGETVEHFPRLHRWQVVEEAGRPRLRNVTAAGDVELHDELVFHGGEGATLEMRVFSEASLLDELRRAGFEPQVRGEDAPEWGIVWRHPWSLPVVARATRPRG